MERLAWVEVLNRYGDVTSRHPVYAWPFRIGRAYDCDLILDDPYIAPDHVEISGENEGGFHLTDLGSKNGLTIVNLPGRRSEVDISPDDIFRIGHTQFRIRPSSYAVSAEMPYSKKPWQRRPTVLLASVIALLAVLLVGAFLDYTEDGISTIIGYVIVVGLMVCLWITAWSFGGRLFSGKTNFIPHAVIGCLGMMLLLASDLLINYSSFAFDSPFISSLSLGATFLTMALVFYLHLRLISRASCRIVAGIAATIAFLFLGSSLLIGSIRNERDLDHQSYRSTIGPPSMLVTEGKSPEIFISSMTALKSRLQE